MYVVYGWLMTLFFWQLVVDWLEKGAEEDLDDYYNRFEFFADQTGTWYVS